MRELIVAIVVIVVLGGAGVMGWAQERMTPEQEAEARRMLGGIKGDKARGIPVLPAEVEPVVVEEVSAPVKPAALPAEAEAEAEAETALERLIRDEDRRLEIRRLEEAMQKVVDARARKAVKRGAGAKRLSAEEEAGARAVMDELSRVEEEEYQPRGAAGTGVKKRGSDGTKQTRQEQLAELLKIKGTMTEEEYQRRRVEILVDSAD